MSAPAATTSSLATPSRVVRTLFVTFKNLYPAFGGSAIRNWQNITAASAQGPVGVCVIGGSGLAFAPGVATVHQVAAGPGARGNVSRILRVISRGRHPLTDRAHGASTRSVMRR